MRKLTFIFSFFLLFTCLAFAQQQDQPGAQPPPPEHSCRPAAGFVPDEAAAVKIAEAVLVPIYGQDTIDKEKPLKVRLKDGIWTVEGTLYSDLGGVAVIEISKDDGRILSVIHGE